MKWHQRLGHINAEYLYKILNKNNINNSINEIKNIIFQCEICLKAKYYKKINKESTNIEKEYNIGERIHSDLGGPISPKTYDNKSYYMTILDKKSRYLFTQLLSRKNEAFQAFENIKNIIKNQNNITIKEFFSNNGKEYINKDFELLFNKFGIIHLQTPVYIKEPNGLIERINLTLMNKVKYFLFLSEV